MKTKRKTGPRPLPRADKRVPAIVTLSPNEKKALARIHGRTPFSTWARGVLMDAAKEPKQ
jgi:hypothetical protein